jgi:hypothetical protein
MPVTPSTSLDLNPNTQSSPSRGIAKAVPKPKPMSVSPRKAKKEFSKPEPEWRRSDIPEDVEITKGNAQKIFKVMNVMPSIAPLPAFLVVACYLHSSLLLSVVFGD